MIAREVKQCLGQMMKGVQVVAAEHGDVVRAYTSHWVCQVSFDEPVVLLSVSPKHDTHPLLVASGRASVSILAADQVAQGQYFSYPGRKFQHVIGEYLEEVDGGWHVVPDAIAWLGVEIERDLEAGLDHDLFLGRIVAVGAGRLKEPPLLYSSRLGWRVTGDKAREPGRSIRDELLERLGPVAVDGGDDEET